MIKRHAEQIVLSTANCTHTFSGGNPYYGIVWISRRPSAIIAGCDHYQVEVPAESVEFLQTTSENGDVSAFCRADRATLGREPNGEWGWYSGTDY